MSALDRLKKEPVSYAYAEDDPRRRGQGGCCCYHQTQAPKKYNTAHDIAGVADVKTLMKQNMSNSKNFANDMNKMSGMMQRSVMDQSRYTASNNPFTFK